MEEGTNLWTQNKQTKYVEKVKDSKIDWQTSSCMEKFEDRMTNMENSIKEQGRQMREMRNRIEKHVREAVASVTIRMAQLIESEKDKIKISVRIHDHIQTLTGTV
jgi:hypothetical protein